jgi:signal transduction histidine kinase
VRINNHKRFAYKLEGFNENWVKTSEQNPNITYNSLRAGSYTLCVRILNEDGSLGTEESQLDITIQPPLYRTRWMILLYMLVIAAGAWLFIRWYQNKLKEKANLEQLQRDVEKRQWMSEMRSQMQKEGMRFQTKQTEDEAVEVIHESDAIVEEKPAVSEPPKIEFHRSEGDMVAFLKDICDHFKAPEDKKMKITFNSPLESIPMSFDETQIRKALDILLSNSVRFTPSYCKVQVTALKPSNDKVALLIADNGIGIPEDSKPHMFEPYIGGGDDDEGIGLDVVKQIVDAHHGTIKADDNPGGGTVFTITLPVEDPEIEEATIIEDES